MMLRTRLEKLERTMTPRDQWGRVFGVVGLNYSEEDVTAFLSAHGVIEQPGDLVICIRGMPAPATDGEPTWIGWLGPAPTEAMA